jgi:hypothetical protein
MSSLRSMTLPLRGVDDEETTLVIPSFMRSSIGRGTDGR